MNLEITYPYGYSSKLYITRYECPQSLIGGVAYPPPAIYIYWVIIAWIFRIFPLDQVPGLISCVDGFRIDILPSLMIIFDVVYPFVVRATRLWVEVGVL
jgi:hypothetical protein